MLNENHIKITIIATLFMFPHFSSAENLTNKLQYKLCSITSADVKDANLIEDIVLKYLDLLDRVNSFSFREKSIDAETSVSLVEEKDIVKRNLGNVLISARKIKKNKSSCSLKEWVIISQHISTSIRMMDDFERFELIDECKTCIFDMVGIGVAYRNINIKLSTLK